MDEKTNIQMPTCPLKMGNLCNDRCAWYLIDEDDEEDFICAIALLAQAVAGGDCR